MPGVKSISGSAKCKNGNIITFKTYKNGQTRMYISGPHERATAPSEDELRRRQLFAICSRVTNFFLKYFALDNTPELRKLIFAATRKTFRFMQNYCAENYTWEEVKNGLLCRLGIPKKATPAQVIRILEYYVSKN